MLAISALVTNMKENMPTIASSPPQLFFLHGGRHQKEAIKAIGKWCTKDPACTWGLSDNY